MHEEDTFKNRNDLDGIVPGLSGEALGGHLRRVMETERLRRPVEEVEPLGPHPDPERLLALRAGELRAEDQEPLLAHLGDCPDCTGLMAFFAAAAGPETADDEVRDAAWSRLPGRLTQEPEPILEARREPAWAHWRETLRQWVASLGFDGGGFRLGAELAGVAAFGLVVGLWQNDHARLERLATPQANVPLFELADTNYRGITRGVTTGEGSGPREGAAPAAPWPGGPGAAPSQEQRAAPHRIELGPGEDLFTLALDLEADFPRYRIRLLDAMGEERWRDEPLQVDDYGIALVGLHQSFVGSGRFTVEVVTEGGREAKRWVFPIEIVAP